MLLGDALALDTSCFHDFEDKNVTAKERYPMAKKEGRARERRRSDRTILTENKKKVGDTEKCKRGKGKQEGNERDAGKKRRHSLLGQAVGYAFKL